MPPELELTKPYALLFAELRQPRYRTYGVYEYFVARGAQPDPAKVNVILRFDVDDGLHLCPRLADQLAAWGIAASFYFLTHPDRYYRIWESDVPRYVHERGFEVGLHSDHYYEQLAFGKPGLESLRRDLERLSQLIGSPVRGIVYHGHPGIKPYGKRNWDLYKYLSPQELGVAYHDGLQSNYTKPNLERWQPNTDYNLTDYLSMRNGWKYFPAYPVRQLQRAQPGQSVHILMHPQNLFPWWRDWDTRYGEPVPAPLPRREEWKRWLRVRLRYQCGPLARRLKEQAFHIFAAVVIALLRPCFRGMDVSAAPPRDWDEYTTRHFAKGMDFYRQRLREYGLLGHRRVLDAGCGSGQWLIAFRAEGCEVYGVDPYPPAVLTAARKLQEYGANAATLCLAPAEHLPFRADAFDLLFCYGVFMYTDHEQTLREFARVLAPGGRLFLTVDGVGYFLLKMKYGLLRRDVAMFRSGLRAILRTLWHRYVRRSRKRITTFLTFGQLRRLLEKHGFRVIENGLEVPPSGHPPKVGGFPTFLRCLAEKGQGGMRD
ncbi:MAG: methyltransferase domain-containing protein [Abditibacteriales bacterium]|nr:methyltransferase domain-containing protein [Abditibacteriales bacterium]MDW8364267.1 methyltransferase domain-containing protein [Abditibacteriales bacterium]